MHERCADIRQAAMQLHLKQSRIMNKIGIQNFGQSVFRMSLADQINKA